MAGMRSQLLVAVAIAAITLPAAGFFYLVTTFLFAFSGGQYLMVPIVSAGPIVVLTLTLVIAAVAWIFRSPVAAIKAAAIVTGAGWGAAIVVEWLISFRLGASIGAPGG